jgi:hypothetical protein
VAEQEFRVWLLDHEKRITRLETRGAEARLRQVDISATKLALLSAGTGLLIFALTWLATAMGWM